MHEAKNRAKNHQIVATAVSPFLATEGKMKVGSGLLLTFLLSLITDIVSEGVKLISTSVTAIVCLEKNISKSKITRQFHIST